MVMEGFTVHVRGDLFKISPNIMYRNKFSMD